MISPTLRQAEVLDLPFIANCFQAEGRASATIEELKNLLLFDYNGCLVAEDGGDPLGFCYALRYDKCGVLGLVARGGVNCRVVVVRELLEQASEYLLNRGCERLIADVSDAVVSAFERAGFFKLGRILQFAGTIYARTHHHVRPMRRKDLRSITALDSLCFGANRRFIIERRFSAAPQFCKVLAPNRTTGGYVMGRRIGNSVAIGPWVMWSRDDCPMDLLEGLAVEAAGETLVIDVLETNRGAVKLLRAMGFVESISSVWRMQFGSRSNLILTNTMYAAGSPFMG
jgi:hypothetical protein